MGVKVEGVPDLTVSKYAAAAAGSDGGQYGWSTCRGA